MSAVKFWVDNSVGRLLINRGKVELKRGRVCRTGADFV